MKLQLKKLRLKKLKLSLTAFSATSWLLMRGGAGGAGSSSDPISEDEEDWSDPAYDDEGEDEGEDGDEVFRPLKKMKAAHTAARDAAKHQSAEEVVEPPLVLHSDFVHRASVAAHNQKLAAHVPELYGGQPIAGVAKLDQQAAAQLSGGIAFRALGDYARGALVEEMDVEVVGPAIRPESTFVLDRERATGPHDVMETMNGGELVPGEVKSRVSSPVLSPRRPFIALTHIRPPPRARVAGAPRISGNDRLGD